MGVILGGFKWHRVCGVSAAAHGALEHTPVTDPEVLVEATRMVLGASTPRARTIAAYTLLLSVEALGCPELGSAVAAALAVFEGQETPDTLLVGALTLSGNAVLHRGLKAGLIEFEARPNGGTKFTFKGGGEAFVCGWAVFQAVISIVGDAGPTGLWRAVDVLRDALGLLHEKRPDAAAKMATFFRDVDTAAISRDSPLEPSGTG